jgi:hypothetical protein
MSLEGLKDFLRPAAQSSRQPGDKVVNEAEDQVQREQVQ